MLFFRIYLLIGLVLHKVVWMAMKRRIQDTATTAGRSHPLSVRLARLVKLAILLLVAVQTVLPDILPILEDALLLRVVGGVLYTLGLVAAVLGRIQLGDNWSDIEVGNIAVDHQVVSRGVYRYMRHPIYVGDLLLLLGLELGLNSWMIVLAAGMVPPVLIRAIQEERSLCKVLTGYEDYACRTKRFIPFIV